MDYNNILFTVENGIATITFNRPKVLNALNSELMDELSDALKRVSANEEIRVLILTGSGEKSFVAGADIMELSRLNVLGAKYLAGKSQKIINMLQALPIPVIAAVNGFALGGGTEIAMACDFIYASENAMFGQPEINLGLIPGYGGTQRLPRAIGINRAKELIFTGRMITALEAKEMGLVNKVFPQKELMNEVMKTAALMASKGKVSLRAAKDAINQGLNVDLATGCSIEADAFAVCFAGEDSKEGTRAFLEKRKAQFTGGLKG
ncbi:MAG: enoyl-CoA hydratase-related protein [Thermodesulfobacteriota bacterium]